MVDSQQNKVVSRKRFLKSLVGKKEVASRQSNDAVFKGVTGFSGRKFPYRRGSGRSIFPRRDINQPYNRIFRVCVIDLDTSVCWVDIVITFDVLYAVHRVIVGFNKIRKIFPAQKEIFFKLL